MAEKSLNRTVEEINPLLDKIYNDYSRQEIDNLISAIHENITTIQTNIAALSERVAILEGGENP